MFNQFKQQFQQHFAAMLQGQQTLYLTDVNRDEMWETYLNSFSPEERQGYTCNCCRQFIKNYGNIVILADGKMKSIWDFTIGNLMFDALAHTMKRFVTTAPIKDVFVTDHAKLGTDTSVQLLEDKTTITWQHLFFQLPTAYVSRSSKSEDSVKSAARGIKDVFKRSLEEITVDSLDIVLDLIGQNSLYRGAEFEAVLRQFLDIKKKYDKLAPALKDNFCWENASKNGVAVAKIRNTSIGTLLTDITEGKELDRAVRAFESIMAPTNYKRPNAIITNKMIVDAEKAIGELGLLESLGRRFATPDDLNINDLVFVDRDAKKANDLFGQLKENLPVNPKTFSKVDEVTVDDFVNKILPTATAVEVLLENQHAGNMVSLIAPKNMDAPTLFKWDNGFSWSYKDGLADSMKERVKAAGGNINGVLRFSIQWNDSGQNNIDFDAHAIEPNGNEISFRNNRYPTLSAMSGSLDVDIISPGSQVAVENIVWTDGVKMKYGTYNLFVHNYASRNSNGGFSAEVEFDGETHTFEYGNNLRGHERVDVAVVTYSAKGFEIQSLVSSKSQVQSKNVWGLDTNKLHKVSMITKSPNYWGENRVGNEHLFFIIEGAENNETVRGFSNEFLKQDLLEHKRVFETLGSKMKVEPSHKQVSGIGFSSTTKGSLICKVEGNFSRTIKIKF